MKESTNDLVKEKKEETIKGNFLDELFNKFNSVKEGFTGNMFSIKNIVIFFIIMFIYLIIMHVLKSGNIETSDSYESNVGKTIDFGVLVILGLAFYNLIIYTKNKDIKTATYEFINYITEYVDEPMSVLNSIFILVGFYVAVYLFKVPISGPNKPTSVSIFESFAWGFLLIIVLVDVIKYFFDISLRDMTDIIKMFLQEQLDYFAASESENESNNETEKEKSSDTEKEDKTENETENNATDTPSATNEDTKTDGNGKKENKDTAVENKDDSPVLDSEKEVFNVSNNLYTYDDARNVCKSLKADLATYDQVEQAYRNGAEWCNYGWSEDQMALFPTQKESWNKLQNRDGKTKKDECRQYKNIKINNDCGRPGVNGGYISNPYVRFGVNCYGKKPEPNESDLELMKSQKMLPQNETDKELEEKVNKFEKQGVYLPLSSHNYKKWSEKYELKENNEKKKNKQSTK